MRRTGARLWNRHPILRLCAHFSADQSKPAINFILSMFPCCICRSSVGWDSFSDSDKENDVIPSKRMFKIFFACVGLVCMVLLVLMSGCETDSKNPSEKELYQRSRTIPGSDKVSSSIREVLNEMEAQGMNRQNARERNAASLSNPLVKVNEEGSIQTYIHVDTFGDEEKALLEKYEVVIEVANKELGIIQAWIPFDRVNEVAQLSFVKRITPPSYGVQRTGKVKTVK